MRREESEKKFYKNAFYLVDFSYGKRYDNNVRINCKKCGERDSGEDAIICVINKGKKSDAFAEKQIA